MNIKFSISVLFLFLTLAITAQTIKVNPYLQDASPHSIYILWETNFGEESIVEWGLTEELGNTAEGTSETSFLTAQIHTVFVEGLERFTKYFYRVKTGLAYSEIYSFKTPPFASDNQPFRIAVMSDMQQDGAFPNKFNEVVEDGIIDFLTEEFGTDIIDELALVLIPGDLVPSGNNYSQWENMFFDPAQELFSRVPVYPVLGNHEDNTSYYFQYFKMPENGTAGFEEHWWHKDYGNVRVIGLNSNAPFTNQEQLDWLDEVLENTCSADSIDFVFAQLHHPHKSELWTPGELPYTGQVIEKLEQFSTDCGKPSIHFFGHTHAYSRGNSRDHRHLWINAATAGGAIDNWGEYPNFDYDEFSKSQDNYGFVSVEITNDDNPKLIIKRVIRGDQDFVIDNEVTDSLVIHLMPTIVNTPVPEYPVDIEISPECVTLKANGFSSPTPSAQHGQSHWQVSLIQNSFVNPVFETWKNFENWYFEIDTQANDDLTDEKVTGIEENQNYFWRVRYRDQELNWSDWSNPVGFSTSVSVNSANLVSNPGAEDGLEGWTTEQGIVEALTDGTCNGITPHSGVLYFAVGGLCDHSEIGICTQVIDVTSYTDSIDAGVYKANFGGYLSNWSGDDLPSIRILFLNQSDEEIGVSESISSFSSSWNLVSGSAVIPVNTTSIVMELTGTRFGGLDNDSYLDDIYLNVGPIEFDCSPPQSTDDIISLIKPIPNYNVVPNPIIESGSIIIPSNYSDVRIYIMDNKGSKANFDLEYSAGKIIINKNRNAKGAYSFMIKNKGIVVGKGSFIII